MQFLEEDIIVCLDSSCAKNTDLHSEHMGVSVVVCKDAEEAKKESHSGESQSSR